MKKKHIVFTGGLSILLAASLILNAVYICQDISKNNHTAGDEGVTVLKTNLSMTWTPGIPMEGWLIEHLKKELGIEVWQEDYPVMEGDSIDCLNWLDLCCMHDAEGYYDAVREGKLKNLENDIMKRTRFYQRYHNAFDQIKADTFKHTGREGIFGVPIGLTYFNHKGYEGHCLTIPVNSSHPEQALRLIAYSATDHGIMNITYGPEGEMWKKKNGKYVVLKNVQEIEEVDEYLEAVKGIDGMENFRTYECCLELVGNTRLGEKLVLKPPAD